MKKFKIIVLLFTLVILAYSCSSDDTSENDNALEEMETIAGNYSGSWSSVTPTNTYDQIPASVRIQETTDPNRFVGEFFFTSNYTSCCNSGANDGSIVIDLDGDTITSFQYTDILPNCNGNFSGTGVISENGSITINFTGSDCEGAHTDGVLRL